MQERRAKKSIKIIKITSFGEIKSKTLIESVVGLAIEPKISQQEEEFIITKIETCIKINKRI
jgi:hypothetical protein